MNELNVLGPMALVSLILGLWAGITMYRADFCVTAMFRDIFLLRDVFMLRQLVVLVSLSMLLFELGRLSGFMQPYPFPLLGAPALTSLIGGTLFGIGMVLAGGCVVGTLYKMGGGSVLSLTAFAGLLIGSTLYTEIHPLWSNLAEATRLSDAVTLTQWLQVDPTLLLPLAGVLVLLSLYWYRRGLLQRPGYARGYLQPLHAALILAIIGTLSYLTLGMPMGITTAYTKLGTTLESLFIPEYVSRLSYLQGTPLQYSPPFTQTVVTGGAGPGVDAIAAIQYPLITGIVLGALLYSLKIGEFRWYYRLPPKQYVTVLIGGLLLGLSARMVPGCNVWHLWGGLPILANQSLLFAIGLFPGAWLGSWLLAKWIITRP